MMIAREVEIKWDGLKRNNCWNASRVKILEQLRQQASAYVDGEIAFVQNIHRFFSSQSSRSDRLSDPQDHPIPPKNQSRLSRRSLVTIGDEFFASSISEESRISRSSPQSIKQHKEVMSTVILDQTLIFFDHRIIFLGNFWSIVWFDRLA